MPHPWRDKTYGVCEHGYDVYDEWSGEPGFRDSEMETDCPICKERYPSNRAMQSMKI